MAQTDKGYTATEENVYTIYDGLENDVSYFDSCATLGSGFSQLCLGPLYFLSGLFSKACLAHGYLTMKYLLTIDAKA